MSVAETKGFNVPTNVQPVGAAEPTNLPVPVPSKELVLVVGKRNVVPANTPELRGIVTARNSHVLFDDKTARHGDSSRLPFHRFIGEYGGKAALGAVCSAGISGVTAIALGIFATGIAIPVAIVGGGGSLALLAAGFFASMGIQKAENSAARKRPLPGHSLDALRTAFEAPTTSALERAVIARLAEDYFEDLDSRKVRGEGSRDILRNLKRAGESLDPDSRAAADAIVKCFNITHDERGMLLPTMTNRVAEKLEYIIEDLDPSLGEKVRAMLLALLFEGDIARQDIDYGVESRLYRVLTSIEPPNRDPEAPARAPTAADEIAA